MAAGAVRTKVPSIKFQVQRTRSQAVHSGSIGRANQRTNRIGCHNPMGRQAAVRTGNPSLVVSRARSHHPLTSSFPGNPCL
jgi:hypothetical protein